MAAASVTSGHHEKQPQMRNSQRIHHPKVSTGCKTCKKRHLKCDETKPNCWRCTSTGRTCDGYVVRNTKIFVPSWERASQVAATSPAIPRIISTEEGTQLKRIEFHYFLDVATPSMAGAAFMSSGDGIKGLVWLYSPLIPAVRHLALAISARHRDTMALSTERQTTAMLEYHRALLLLNRAKDQPAVDTVLLVGLLFAIYEHFDPVEISRKGLIHHAAAFRIFNDPATEWNSATKTVWTVAHRIDLILSMFKTPIFLPGENTSNLPPQAVPELPMRFSSPVEMRHTMFKIFRWRFVYSLHIRHWNSRCPGFLQLQDLMTRWYTMVRQYISDTDAGLERPAEDLQLATEMSIQFRMMIAAVANSISEASTSANMVELSDPSQVLILVPVEPVPNAINWSASHTSVASTKAFGIWPAVECVKLLDDLQYIKFTFYAEDAV